jgi:hypothetical protein
MATLATQSALRQTPVYPRDTPRAEPDFGVLAFLTADRLHLDLAAALAESHGPVPMPMAREASTSAAAATATATAAAATAADSAPQSLGPRVLTVQRRPLRRARPSPGAAATVISMPSCDPAQRLSTVPEPEPATLATPAAGRKLGAAVSPGPQRARRPPAAGAARQTTLPEDAAPTSGKRSRSRSPLHVVLWK